MLVRAACWPIALSGDRHLPPVAFMSLMVALEIDRSGNPSKGPPSRLKGEGPSMDLLIEGGREGPPPPTWWVSKDSLTMNLLEKAVHTTRGKRLSPS